MSIGAEGLGPVGLLIIGFLDRLISTDLDHSLAQVYDRPLTTLRLAHQESGVPVELYRVGHE